MEKHNSYNNNKFQISSPAWNDKFELPDGSYSLSNIQDYLEYIFKNHEENTGKCDKSCYVGEYLDYENCKYRKKLVDKLTEECTENIDEAKIAEMNLFERGNECVCSSTIFVVLIAMIFTINIRINAYFVYPRWYLKKDVYLLSLVPVFKQQLMNLQMGKVKQIEIKNRTYYFYKNIINIAKFNSSLLKIDKKSYKDIGIYYTGFMKIKEIGEYENIYSVKPLYLIIGKVDGHIECNPVGRSSTECISIERKKWK